MTTRTYTDERRWANTDPSRHFNQVERSEWPDWHNEYTQALKAGDYDRAQLIRDQNRTLSTECKFGDCSDCHYPNCECGHHRATVFKKEHEALKSCRERSIEEEELEVA